jgi:hypothetical protein
MILLIIGIFFVIAAFILFSKSIRLKHFNKNIENNKDFNRTIGTVICDAYHINEATKINKAVTPIVEYEVNGEKYEAANSVLETGAELPVGVKVVVWYKKHNPKIAVLGSDLANYSIYILIGVFLLIFGSMFILQYF